MKKKEAGMRSVYCESRCILSAKPTKGPYGFKGYEGKEAVISGDRLNIRAYDDTSYYTDRLGEDYTKTEMTELVKFLLDHQFVSFADVTGIL